MRRFFNDRPLVIWRSRAGLHAAEDICPHRGAPLSDGRVIKGDLSCPYHGWRFGGDGACNFMSGSVGERPRVRLGVTDVSVSDGLIFFPHGVASNAAFQAQPLIEGPFAVVDMHDEIRTTIPDIAENILDTTHTGVLHRGHLRREAPLRQITPQVRAGEDWIEAEYPPDATPNGFIGRMIGGPRYTIIDRFRAPSIAEVTYKEGERVRFVFRFYLAPSVAGALHVFARLAVAGAGPVAALKAQGVAALLRPVLAQDRRMLESVTQNRTQFAQRQALIAPQDLLRSGIEAIIAGRVPHVPLHIPDLVL